MDFKMNDTMRFPNNVVYSFECSIDMFHVLWSSVWEYTEFLEINSVEWDGNQHYVVIRQFSDWDSGFFYCNEILSLKNLKWSFEVLSLEDIVES